MDKRLNDAGVMKLPMTRHDIADYLGLTIETVSRSLSRLCRAGVLDLGGGKFHREIRICNREKLRSLDL